MPSKLDMPRWVEPQAPTLHPKVPTDPNWIHEIKHDGWRMMAYVENGNCRLVSRNRRDWTARYREIAQALEKIKGTAIIDGEIAWPDECGITRLHGRASNLQPAYYAFDLLWRDGKDWRKEPLVERKAALKKIIAPAVKAGRILYADHVKGEAGATLYAFVKEHGCEGIVSKRADSPYDGGRSLRWLKIKPEGVRRRQAELAKEWNRKATRAR